MSDSDLESFVDEPDQSEIEGLELLTSAVAAAATAISVCAIGVIERQRRTESGLRREIELLEEERRRDAREQSRKKRLRDVDNSEAEAKKTKLRKTDPDLQSNINTMTAERARTFLLRIYTELPEAAHLFEHEFSRDQLPTAANSQVKIEPEA